jgi:Cu(I)/Ag(I) efflux system membrane fusion protein
MSKYLWALVLPSLIFAEMQCGAGKCGASMSKETPKIEKKSSTDTMQCASGKCSSSMEKNIPKIKKVPKVEKENTRKTTRPTITQLFNVKTIKVQNLKSAKKAVNYGYILAQDSSKIDVTAWYAGFVETLYADTLYTYVKKGEALVKVYSPEVYKAKQDYLNSLNYNNAHASVGMLQSAKAKLALLGVHKKEIADIKSSRKVDEFTTIYASQSGWIFEKNINQGSSFSSKKRLFQIVNLDKVWMEVKLFQSQLKDLEKFTEFKVSVQGIKQSYQGKKSLVYPMIDPKEATFTLRLLLDNKKGLLKTGMYAKVESASKAKASLVIPRTAVIRKGGLWYAFLATEFKGEYEPIEISIKPLDAKLYEVTKGLTLSDTIVNNALFMMDSDAQINAIY